MPEPFLTVKFAGGAELQKILEELPEKVARRLLREALGDSAALWQAEMEQRAPRLEQVKLALKASNVRIPGDLARHIAMRVTVNADIEGAALVGPSRRTFWAMFLEFGTRKMRAMPFIVPAYEAMKQAVLDKFVSVGQEIVTEEAGKHV